MYLRDSVAVHLVPFGTLKRKDTKDQFLVVETGRLTKCFLVSMYCDSNLAKQYTSTSREPRPLIWLL